MKFLKEFKCFIVIALLFVSVQGFSEKTNNQNEERSVLYERYLSNMQSRKFLKSTKSESEMELTGSVSISLLTIF